jgi:pentatricopeptide repeat protein
MRLAGVDATAVTYNALIDACVSAGEPTEAMFALLSAMVDAGHRPDVVTYTTLLKHFGRDGDVVAARWLMREMQADETVAVDAAR